MNRAWESAPTKDAGRTRSLARILARSEALKARKRLAVWILFGIYAGAVALTTILIAKLPGFDELPLVTARGWTRIPVSAPSIGALCLGVGLALLVAPEFRWRTARQNVIDGLSKSEFFAGKLLLWAGLVAAALAVAWALGAASMLALPPEDGPVAPTRADLKAWTGFALALGVWGGAAFLLASVVRSGGPAVGVLLGFFFLESMGAVAARAIATMRGWDFALSVVDYSPGVVADTLGAPWLYYDSLALMSAMQRATAGRSDASFEALAVAALAYIAAFAALSYANFRKRDL